MSHCLSAEGEGSPHLGPWSWRRNSHKNGCAQGQGCDRWQAKIQATVSLKFKEQGAVRPGAPRALPGGPGRTTAGAASTQGALALSLWAHLPAPQSFLWEPLGWSSAGEDHLHFPPRALGALCAQRLPFWVCATAPPPTGSLDDSSPMSAAVNVAVFTAQ